MPMTIHTDSVCPADQSHIVLANECGMGGGRVYINKEQYFEGVPPNVWNFHVGGYQVCHKWLKDCKGRTLMFEDIQHYQRVVAALGKTIELMEQLRNMVGGRLSEKINGLI